MDKLISKIYYNLTKEVSVSITEGVISDKDMISTLNDLSIEDQNLMFSLFEMKYTKIIEQLMKPPIDLDTSDYNELLSMFNSTKNSGNATLRNLKKDLLQLITQKKYGQLFEFITIIKTFYNRKVLIAKQRQEKEFSEVLTLGKIKYEPNPITLTSEEQRAFDDEVRSFYEMRHHEVFLEDATSREDRSGTESEREDVISREGRSDTESPVTISSSIPSTDELSSLVGDPPTTSNDLIKQLKQQLAIVQPVFYSELGVGFKDKFEDVLSSEISSSDEFIQNVINCFGETYRDMFKGVTVETLIENMKGVLNAASKNIVIRTLQNQGYIIGGTNKTIDEIFESLKETNPVSLDTMKFVEFIKQDVPQDYNRITEENLHNLFVTELEAADPVS
ncbi:MAG: hypothetical protein VW397_09215, partial [Candidatus Margulisiibacteriota bacterium]